jgi:hypothetical protein
VAVVAVVVPVVVMVAVTGMAVTAVVVRAGHWRGACRPLAIERVPGAPLGPPGLGETTVDAARRRRALTARARRRYRALDRLLLDGAAGVTPVVDEDHASRYSYS